MAARGFIGAGDVYMNPLVGGVAQGWVGPFEATKFEIKPNVELKEQTSRGKNTYGQVIESVALGQPADLSIEFAEVNKSTLATALLATSSAFSQTSATVADQAFVAKKGVWVPVTKQKISAVVVKNTGGVTTYQLGIDYIVNADLGWIKILPGSVIVDNAALLVSFIAGALTGTSLAGATQTDVRAMFKFDGKNQVDGLGCQVTIYEGIIAADSAFDFLADDFNTVSLPGRMKTPAGYTEPFTLVLLDA